MRLRVGKGAEVAGCAVRLECFLTAASRGQCDGFWGRLMPVCGLLREEELRA